MTAPAPKPCGHGSEHACAHHYATDAASLQIDPAALISARGISVARQGRDLLIDVNLDIHAREIVTLIGPNGAGKTTLVRVLLGLERPDKGVVHRRRDLKIGYVPQRFDSDAVIPMTVERFLMLGGTYSSNRIGEILEHVDASAVRHQQLGELSGGQLQRVVLARALLRAPNLLVLDEPVQGVDYSGEADLYNLIGRLRDESGFGVLLVSHDLHVVMARSDKVICLNRHVCCSGVPEAVAQHPAYGRLFGPEAARAFALYRHHHDHSHDLSGMPQPAADEPAGDAARGDE
ncbi:MAG: metal ABC transporter ATP-binding protein [Hyphomicrobium sp.]